MTSDVLFPGATLVSESLTLPTNLTASCTTFANGYVEFDITFESAIKCRTAKVVLPAHDLFFTSPFNTSLSCRTHHMRSGRTLVANDKKFHK